MPNRTVLTIADRPVVVWHTGELSDGDQAVIRMELLLLRSVIVADCVIELEITEITCPPQA